MNDYKENINTEANLRACGFSQNGLPSSCLPLRTAF